MMVVTVFSIYLVEYEVRRLCLVIGKEERECSLVVSYLVVVNNGSSNSILL